MASGAVREIRRLYPDAHITMQIFLRSIQMAETCPYVNEIFTNPRPYPDWHDIFSFFAFEVQLAKKLLERRFDVCYSFGNFSDSAFLMYASGAKTRLAFEIIDEKYSMYNVLATHCVPYVAQHSVTRCLSMIDHVLYAPVTNREIEVWLTNADLKLAKSLLSDVSKPIYALCMGGTRIGKHYPPEKYARVVEMILSSEESTIVILGGGDEDLKSAEIFKSNLPEKFHEHIIDLTNKLTYRQSTAVLCLCEMYIGNDTSTMHMAAAIKTPVLSPLCFPADIPLKNFHVPKIYSPYNVPSVLVRPEHALPECANAVEPRDLHGCIVRDRPHCIAQIEPETIFKGFHLLKERIAQNIIEPLHIH